MGAYSNDLMMISASKEELLKTLNKNLIQHKNDYNAAHIGWKKEVQSHKNYLFGCLADTDDPKKYKVYMDKLSSAIKDEPTSHEKDYDIAIEMLEWHQGEEFRLERDQFRQYVQDRWDWQRSFTQATLRFSG